ncbi:hypothetical protein GCM10009118_07370 [Wandonia haliotis]|uniref:Uncharacterized protein n=1 Tax=Wandonia haliotis TaxID=574963 RepID=A0ABN1MM82_9FLAO
MGVIKTCIVTIILSYSFSNSFVFGQCGVLIDSINIHVFSNSDLGFDSVCNRGVTFDQVGESLSVLPSDYIQFQKKLIPDRIFADYSYLDSIVRVSEGESCFDLKILVIDSLEKNGNLSLIDKNGKLRSVYQYSMGHCLFMLFYNENEELIRQICFVEKENIIDTWFYQSKVIRISFPLNDGFVLKEYYPNGKPFLEYYYNSSGHFFEGYKYSKSGELTLVKLSNRGKTR